MKVEILDKYIRVSSDEGLFLTDYKDGGDILDFNSFKVMCSPTGTDLSNIREISGEENDKYNELQQIRLRELDNEGKY